MSTVGGPIWDVSEITNIAVYIGQNHISDSDAQIQLIWGHKCMFARY